MAKTGAVWGIDIGQCALKALRCRADDSDPRRIMAEAFDYIEYPKILSQPDADVETLVHEALEQFLSRNETAGHRVAISVSGQSGLARFIKLPPVESKKIPDIVKYEAKQQIPFALEDVVWDYQQMAGGSVEEGFALETEVGLFAMKRDQVFRSLKPLSDVGIAVDFVQLTPLAICNYVAFDLLRNLPSPEEYDPENPPPSTVVIALGTDTTDLVVTNGYRVWQRSVPIGGNHFTRALTKGLRLTFSKAERLKRNAMKAENPKAVFKAMRPVFSDLVAEIDRSLGYFAGIDRSATIDNVVAMGNAMKLPGLKRYLADHLTYPVKSVSSFRGLAGDAVVGNPRFKDNLLSLCVSYGLCLQGLGRAKIRTNLLPREIVTERLVRDKKPWAVAAVAAIAIGCAISYYGYYSAMRSVDVERPDFKTAIQQANSTKQKADQYESDYQEALTSFETVNTIGKNLLSNIEGRRLWLELFKAISAALPHDPPNKRPKRIAERRELHIESLDCEKFDDLSKWFKPIAKKYADDMQAIYGPDWKKTHSEGPLVGGPADTGDDAAEEEEDDGSEEETEPGAGGQGPRGTGWVIELRGYHFHNDPSERQRGPAFVRNTLLKNLHEVTVKLPTGKEDQVAEVPIRELGIGYPTLTYCSRILPPEVMGNPNGESRRVAIATRPEAGAARPRGNAAPPAGADQESAAQEVRRTKFTVQFCWKPTPPSRRAQIAAQRRAAAKTAGDSQDEKSQVASTKSAAAGE